MSAHLSIFSDTHWTLIGFVIFFTLFVLFVGSTFLKSQIRLHAYLSRLPLQEEASKENQS